MMWPWVFVGIAVLGLIVLVCYALWLWRRASDLFFELKVLGKRTDEMATLLGEIDVARLTLVTADESDMARTADRT